MLELLSITQHRVDVTHHRNHSLSLTRTLLTILDGEQRVDHLVNMSAILRKVELTSRKVIILSHCHAINHELLPAIYSIRAIN